MSTDLIYHKNPNFPNRYISPEKLFFFLQTNLGDCISQVGTSYLGKPIYKASFGNGKTKVLAWSQMHGNESNSTHAMLDLWESLEHQPELKQNLFSEISLDFIFMLNPDGAEKWSRRNALEIDLNRDFLQESSKEFPILKQMALNGNYDYALNLHEQRTIFSSDGVHPATLSFLSPSENIEREITPTRKKSMAVISEIVNSIKDLIINQIARYSDEFYPTSAGDNFMKSGLPTILFEGGHFPEDYKREGTRKIYTIALYEGLKAISRLKGSDEGWENYFKIPENRETHFDIIYRNVALNTDYPCVLDIAVQYKEEINAGNDEISFVPMVVEIGDCSQKKGWKEIDCTGKYYKSENPFPKLDAVQDFEILVRR
ncbi:MAG: peptidase M14 [Flavobacteriaceae bacterium]|jgi:hypothetical protein|nr:peptidase M14 [Flavobacteriaceae bacterium]